MPSMAARPPWPWLLRAKESTSAKANFHWESPAQIWEVCWLPGGAATCRHRSELQKVILAKLLWVAQRACMPMKTQQLVAAVLSGFRMMFSGNTKSTGAKVELQMGRSWKKYSYMKLAIWPTTAWGWTL